MSSQMRQRDDDRRGLWNQRDAADEREERKEKNDQSVQSREQEKEDQARNSILDQSRESTLYPPRPRQQQRLHYQPRVRRGEIELVRPELNQPKFCSREMSPGAREQASLSLGVPGGAFVNWPGKDNTRFMMAGGLGERVQVGEVLDDPGGDVAQVHVCGGEGKLGKKVKPRCWGMPSGKPGSYHARHVRPEAWANRIMVVHRAPRRLCALALATVGVSEGSAGSEGSGLGGDIPMYDTPLNWGERARFMLLMESSSLEHASGAMAGTTRVGGIADIGQHWGLSVGVRMRMCGQEGCEPFSQRETCLLMQSDSRLRVSDERQGKAPGR
ncbi:hypothetical protein DFH06DRAFT_1142905 [Mycena polygramma]|nr:hypothetical protein DFH06DRAFT_1142905 [Mycena polygramma]